MSAEVVDLAEYRDAKRAREARENAGRSPLIYAAPVAVLWPLGGAWVPGIVWLPWHVM
jgi:hypothetical protein